MKSKRTVVLMWNPAISSVKEKDYQEWFEGLGTFNEKFFNWSIHDHDEVGFGDRFVLIRVGEGPSGLMMDGMISSDCRKGKDWSGKGREVYYANLIPMKAFNPVACAEFPTAEQLAKAVPDFDWAGGHSGRILTVEQTVALDVFLSEFYKAHSGQTREYSKMRSRDYAIPASYIHPSEEDIKNHTSVDPQPFIESFIREATGIEPDKLEEKWAEHEHMWVRDKEYLLRTAAEMAFPMREELPYYGGLCLKLSNLYFGQCKERLNAAYAREAADFLHDPELRHKAVMGWLGGSLRYEQEWNNGWAVSPEVIGRIKGMEVLQDYLPHVNFDTADEMLHDFYVKSVSVHWENETIEITISDTDNPDDNPEDILFRLTGNIDIDFTCDNVGYNYIDAAHIGAWRRDQISLTVEGYDLRARADTLEILYPQ